MLSVAEEDCRTQASLFAAVTVSSLQNPVLDSIHWIVNAIWTVTLVLSVVTAFSSYMVFGGLAALLSTEDIRNFCSGVPGSSEERRPLQESSALSAVSELGPY